MMPFVAMSASVSEVLPWSYRVRRLDGDYEWENGNERTTCARMQILKLSVTCRLAFRPSAYISYALWVALQRNELFGVYDGHLEGLQPLVFQE